ncbi:MAG TPA: hypothetical protein VHH88_13755 [Verrucomicrobiae bacterium]|nr:hypothetical protein [Verrucomicrobiae bacterium]
MPRERFLARRFLFFTASLISSLVLSDAGAASRIPTLNDALAARRDVWGEAAMRQWNGPSYEFFEKLLPPPRYVNADFRYYPIVLSAPNSTVKARLISNGSGVNLRGGGAQWNDNGTPVIFRVGPDQLRFGEFFDQEQQEPTLAEGFLPIVQLRYLHQSPLGSEGMVPLTQKREVRAPEIYELEVFASTDAALGSNGVVFARFALSQGIKGVVTAQVDSKSALSFKNGRVLNAEGKVVAWFDRHWKWTPKGAQARLEGTGAATLAIATRPLEAGSAPELNDDTYQREREHCASTWRGILDHGMNIETPEPIVNNAWRQGIIQNFELVHGDRMHYSQGNQYDKIYESEGSDAALAMLVWGYEKDMRRLMVPLMDFTRAGLEFHQAGFKLKDLCRYYWESRDAAAIEQLRSWPKPKSYRTYPQATNSGWQIEAERLDNNRAGPHGLFPLEQYCGDIHTKVQTINANSEAWRALRDLGAVLEDASDAEEGRHYEQVAAQFRKTVLEAIEKSVDRSTLPPFVPVALYTNEPPHDPICDTRIGSYWNIIIGYTIGSGIFPPGSPEENWIPQYQEQHGGLCMGMVRSGGMSNTFWNSEFKINPLYGTRYALDALRRDDVERALTSFYGMLAQGFTRNTFICGEAAGLVPIDEHGRLLSLPPNSAANGHYLSMLRYLLVQDYDEDDDGKPETLRLAFATPRAWLDEGKHFKVERAPTDFGLVSFEFTSNIGQGEVNASVDLPSRDPIQKILLRARVPEGWRVTAASVGAKTLPVDAKGTVDLSGMSGKQMVRFAVSRR